mmetsp:Transcript_35544/g.77610  ORF Transcript_35544/g.77610 Transcript_35544/m.77610 type:complete len:353 (-) Transcript_35544:514-1572(-)|eukprot:CAMPEP_0118957974 /NCGR_PEP_ID=MMETSP1169-20130426/62385_1 /TAXON_ID=36882 /ORGANISM="Pyramimonas obovata, Strain CCMP722" /LENGTH=352 /DNA_ID=CAMNT_0006906077 /DNA_START=171 /DNA_END=1229 /DNA_ORIENTATION=+
MPGATRGPTALNGWYTPRSVQLFLWLSALTPFTLGQTLPPCFPPHLNGTRTTDIRGYWKAAPELMQLPSAQKQIECRTHGAGTRSCALPTRKKSTPKPFKSGNPRKFIPTTCSLQEFSSEALDLALGSRKIFYFGDSVTMQHKGSLSCSLADRNDSAETSGRMVLRNGGRFTFYRVSTGSKGLVRHTERFKDPPPETMSERDICIFNVGVHYNEAKHYQVDFLDIFEKLCLAQKCMPCQIVWRESTHQHFPGNLGGLYVKPDPKCKGCVKVEDEQQLAKANWRNDMANKLMEKYNVPILPAWHMSAIAHDMHPEVGGYNHNGCDCTHYCNFYHGLFETWSQVLQNFLTAFTA